MQVMKGGIGGGGGGGGGVCMNNKASSGYLHVFSS